MVNSSVHDNIVNKTNKVAQGAWYIFKAYGMDINFESGKTEATIHFGGPGARRNKIKLYNIGYSTIR